MKISQAEIKFFGSCSLDNKASTENRSSEIGNGWTRCVDADPSKSPLEQYQEAKELLDATTEIVEADAVSIEGQKCGMIRCRQQ